MGYGTSTSLRLRIPGNGKSASTRPRMHRLGGSQRPMGRTPAQRWGKWLLFTDSPCVAAFRHTRPFSNFGRVGSPTVRLGESILCPDCPHLCRTPRSTCVLFAFEIRLARGSPLGRAQVLRGSSSSCATRSACVSAGTAQRATIRGQRSMGGAPTIAGLRATIWRSSLRCRRRPQLSPRQATRGRHSR